jgi:energy-coupling factor transport system ATP-binding protein
VRCRTRPDGQANVLELRSVSYRYAGYRRLALDRVDLTVADGEIVGLVGPNEGGKSTLCLVAAGLAPGSIGGELTGEVLLDGDSTSGWPTHEPAGRVGIVFADPASQRSGIAGTVFEEVAIGPVNLGLAVDETVTRVRAALGALGIEDLALRAPDRLSGGQSQLVAIASILAMRPRHLVLDEPTAELDPEGRRLVADALASLASAGTAMLIAEHDRELLASLGARIVAIDGGRLVPAAGGGAP